MESHRDAFVTANEVYDMGVPPNVLSMWMTNDLIQVAHKNKFDRFFWKHEVEALIQKYLKN
ncbi:hypothetical protein ERX37_07765 [Macrococcus hajekii]|uniref:Uncharacterized protein n=1 Tax=Macrococcus hajekii TaxID=198482 RepID=A0A4R6BK52_9STAP|nr:hypothetical protein [Macrococcus hajekii]TDM02088.1 hypothetical protein ERX37_07765 [Macrococcus hajekii]GGB10001.1 hypothetical protein GCM10007190_17580 [Macrococcus hajekii]